MARQKYCRKKLSHFFKYVSFKCHILYHASKSFKRSFFSIIVDLLSNLLSCEASLKLPDSYPAFVASFISELPSGLPSGASGLLPGKLCILRRTSLHIFVCTNLGSFVKRRTPW